MRPHAAALPQICGAGHHSGGQRRAREFAGRLEALGSNGCGVLCSVSEALMQQGSFVKRFSCLWFAWLGSCATAWPYHSEHATFFQLCFEFLSASEHVQLAGLKQHGIGCLVYSLPTAGAPSELFKQGRRGACG